MADVTRKLAELLSIDTTKDQPAMVALGGLLSGDFNTFKDVSSMRLANLLRNGKDEKYNTAFPNTQAFDPISAGLGFAPMGVGMIKTKFGRIPETGAEIDALSSQLVRHGENAGNNIQSGASNVSGSRYITFKNPDGTDYQVRISSHADNYPNQLAGTGERFSVDPNSMNTFEMARDWLKEKGINLNNRPPTTPTHSSLLQGTKVSELNALRLSRGGQPVTPDEVSKFGLIDDVGLLPKILERNGEPL